MFYIAIEQNVLTYTMNGEYMKKFERLRNLREDQDLTQSQIGKYLNISQRCYAHYENGTRDIPIEILIQLADLYNVNLDYLVGRTNIKNTLPPFEIR